MSKLQNYADQHPAEAYVVLTPSAYQAKHRHEEAVVTILSHHPDKKKCRCGAHLTDDHSWAEHMADVLFPVHQRSQV